MLKLKATSFAPFSLLYSYLIHDVNPSQLNGASYRSSARNIIDARRDTVMHRATILYQLQYSPSFSDSCENPIGRFSQIGRSSQNFQNDIIQGTEDMSK